MKTHAIIKYFVVITIGVVIVIINSNQLFAQFTALSKVGGNASIIIQYDNQQIHRLGIGTEFTNHTYYPRAWFHQKEIVHQEPAMSKFEGMDENFNSICSMKFIFLDGSTKYNIYQSGIDFLSYFEGPLGSSSSLFLNGENIAINTFQANTLPFTMTASPSSPVYTPLTIYRRQKVEIRDTLDCNNFRMNYSAGLNKIMISDELGNGTWFDPSTFTDNLWMVNNFNDMYASPRRTHIGIGFDDRSEKIYQKLHVVDGNILISRLHNGAPCSPNGSIMFGDVVNDENPYGKWGIEYYNEGLNFWKIHNCQDKNNIDIDDPYNYRLFLKNDGTVGIGCNDTRGYKLAVKGNILCEEVLVRKYMNWPDYVFEENYKLLPLNELESYTKINKHLPEMPTAQDIQNNGVNLGDVSAALLKKVEELTKYVIEQQKEINHLKAAIRKN